jgi:hypothetical protein
MTLPVTLAKGRDIKLTGTCIQKIKNAADERWSEVNFVSGLPEPNFLTRNGIHSMIT